jgi:chemotaxis protein MotB
MAREKKVLAEEGDAGAPEWMVTFSDCMTLLLTFFVLLLSFSSFSDVSKYKKMTVSFADSFESLSDGSEERRAMLSSSMMNYPKKEIEQGSEMRSPSDEATKEGGKKQTQEPDSHENKVFVVPSDKMYWGKGIVLSAQGRALLSDMASFLKEVPNRIVVSECHTGSRSSGDEVGLQRAWSVVNYLKRSGVKMDRLSISSASTIMNEGDTLAENKRTLQVVLLERNVYR